MKLARYDRQGKEIGLKEFIELYAEPSYVKVLRTKVNGRIVSTVWLGINHSHKEDETLIFETAVFTLKSYGKDFHGESLRRRYHTEAEARNGHYEIVGRIQAGDYA